MNQDAIRIIGWMVDANGARTHAILSAAPDEMIRAALTGALKRPLRVSAIQTDLAKEAEDEEPGRV